MGSQYQSCGLTRKDLNPPNPYNGYNRSLKSAYVYVHGS